MYVCMLVGVQGATQRGHVPSGVFGLSGGFLVVSRRTVDRIEQFSPSDSWLYQRCA